MTSQHHYSTFLSHIKGSYEILTMGAHKKSLNGRQYFITETKHIHTRTYSPMHACKGVSGRGVYRSKINYLSIFPTHIFRLATLKVSLSRVLSM